MRGLWVCGVGMLVCFVGMTQLEHFTRQGYAYLALLYTSFIFYAVACALVLRKPPAYRLVWIGIFALGFRLPLLFTTPTLSTDVWRYLWDGHLLTEGINPYEFRVDAPELTPYHTELHSRIEHPWMASPYPPVAQAIFGGVTLIFPQSPTAMQAIFMLFDVLSFGVLTLLLKKINRPMTDGLLYAWNPLVVVEFAHGAHVDSLMTFLILLALYGAVHQHKTGSAVLLGLATLTKFIPALLLPLFIRQWGIRYTLFYLGVVGVGFLPFLGAGIRQEGTGILGAAHIYASQWKTNDGLFFWLVEALENFTSQPIETARLLTMMTLVLVGAWVWRKNGNIFWGAALLVGVYLLLVSAMFPWYLVWLLALLPLLPLREDFSAFFFALAWLYFSAAVHLSYLFYLDPSQPGEKMWIRWVEYIPLYILLGIALGGVPAYRQFRHRQSQNQQTTERENQRIESN